MSGSLVAITPLRREGLDYTEDGRRVLGTIGVILEADIVPVQFVTSMVGMTRENHSCLIGRREVIQEVWMRQPDAETARQEIMKQAVGDWLLLLPSQSSFRPDILTETLREKAVSQRESDVVVLGGGAYFFDRAAVDAELRGEQ